MAVRSFLLVNRKTGAKNRIFPNRTQQVVVDPDATYEIVDASTGRQVKVGKAHFEGKDLVVELPQSNSSVVFKNYATHHGKGSANLNHLLGNEAANSQAAVQSVDAMRASEMHALDDFGSHGAVPARAAAAGGGAAAASSGGGAGMAAALGGLLLVGGGVLAAMALGGKKGSGDDSDSDDDAGGGKPGGSGGSKKPGSGDGDGAGANSPSKVRLVDEGKKLVAKVSDSDGFDGEDVKYTWMRDGKEFKSGKGEDYAEHTPAKSDEGHRIEVKVSFKDSKGNKESAKDSYEVPEGYTTGGPNRPGDVDIVNKAGRLVAMVDDPDGLDPDKISYVWKVDGKTVKEGAGEKNSFYDTQIGDRGSKITLDVSFEDRKGHKEKGDAEYALAKNPSNNNGHAEILLMDRHFTLVYGDDDTIGGNDAEVHWYIDGNLATKEWWEKMDHLNFFKENMDKFRGKTITAKVSFMDSNGNFDFIETKPVKFDKALSYPGAPAKGWAIGISRVGDVLNALEIDSNGNYFHNNEVTWHKDGNPIKRDGVAVKGPRYRLEPGDVGHEITAKVDGWDFGAQKPYKLSSKPQAVSSLNRSAGDDPGSISLDLHGTQMRATLVDKEGVDRDTVVWTWRYLDLALEFRGREGETFSPPPRGGSHMPVVVSADYYDLEGNRETVISAPVYSHTFDRPDSISVVREKGSLKAVVVDEARIRDGSLEAEWIDASTGQSAGKGLTLPITSDIKGRKVYPKVTYVDESGLENEKEGLPYLVTDDGSAPPNTRGDLKVVRDDEWLLAFVRDADGLQNSSTYFGVDGLIKYTWTCGGKVLADKVEGQWGGQHMRITEDMEGKIVTVSATYTDDAGKAETVTEEYKVPRLTFNNFAPLPENPGSLEITEIAGGDTRIGANEREGGTSIAGVVKADIKDDVSVVINSKTFSGKDIDLVDRSDGFYDWRLNLDKADIDSLGLKEDVPVRFTVKAGSVKLTPTIGLELEPGDYRPIMSEKDHMNDLLIERIDQNAFQKAVRGAMDGGSDTFTVGGTSKLFSKYDHDNFDLLVGGQIIDAKISGDKWSHTFTSDELREMGETRDLESIVVQGVLRDDSDNVVGYAHSSLCVHSFHEIFIDAVSGNNIVRGGRNEFSGMKITGTSRNVNPGETIDVVFDAEARNPEFKDSIPGGKMSGKVKSDGTWSVDVPSDVAAKMEALGKGHFAVKAFLRGHEDEAWNSLAVEKNGGEDDSKIVTTEKDIGLSSAIKYIHVGYGKGLQYAEDMPDLKAGVDYSKEIPPADVHHYGYRSTEGCGTAANMYRNFNQTGEMAISSDNHLLYAKTRGGMLQAWAGRLSHNPAEMGSTATDVDVFAVCMSQGLPANPVAIYMDDGADAAVGHRWWYMRPVNQAFSTGSYRHHGATTIASSTSFEDGKLGEYYDPDFIEWPSAGYFPIAALPSVRWHVNTGLSAPFKLLPDHTKITYEISSNSERLERKTYTVKPSDVGQPCGDGVSFVLNRDVLPMKLMKDEIVTVDVTMECQGNVLKYAVKLFDDSAYQHGEGGSYRYKGSHVDPKEASHIDAGGEDKASPEAVSLMVDDTATVLPGDGLLVLGGDGGHDGGHAGNGKEGHRLSAQMLKGARIAGSEGDDVVLISGESIGSDILLGGGDDVVSMGRFKGGLVDGGEGFDKLVFTGAGNATWLSNFQNFELVDLGGAKAEGGVTNILRIDEASIRANHDSEGVLRIEGGKGNKVNFDLEGAELSKAREVVGDDGEKEYAMTYSFQGESYTVMMSESLYNGGSGII